MRVAHEVLAEVFADDEEPVPRWEEGDVALLDTCRASIEVEAFEIKKYPDLFSAAAKLFYATIKNHCFPNANKRFALVLTMVLLRIHRYRLANVADEHAARWLRDDGSPGTWSDVAKWVAETDPHASGTTPDEVIELLTSVFAVSTAPVRPQSQGGV